MMKIIKHFKLKNNKNTVYQNLWDIYTRLWATYWEISAFNLVKGYRRMVPRAR